MSIKKKKNQNDRRPAELKKSKHSEPDGDEYEKADGEDGEGEGDEDEEDEENDEEPVSKGIVAADDLEKSLAELEERTRRQPSRKVQLLDKAKTARLSAKEQRELDSLIKGGVASSLKDDDDLAKAMDVSPALDVLATNLAGAIDGLGENLEKSLAEADERHDALVHVLTTLGAGLRAVAEENRELRKSLDAYLDGPARTPKAEDRPMAKGLDRRAGDDAKKPQGPTKKQMLGALEAMHAENLTKSIRDGRIDFKNEIARVSSNQQPTPAAMAAITAYLANSGASA